MQKPARPALVLACAACASCGKLHDAAQSVTDPDEWARLLDENLDTVDADGEMAMHVAARYENSVAMKVLARAPGSLKAPDNAGRTPLHVAAALGNLRALQDLVDLGAPLEAGIHDEDGTALHVAAKAAHIEAVKLLVKLGARVAAPTNTGATPADVAGMEGHREVYFLLVSMEEAAERDVRRRMAESAPVAEERDLPEFTSWEEARMKAQHGVPEGLLQVNRLHGKNQNARRRRLQEQGVPDEAGSDEKGEVALPDPPDLVPGSDKEEKEEV